jgi:IS30 family transposase
VKRFQNENLISKVLRCLNRNWQPKVTAIAESRDLGTMSLATLFGKLQENELELSRLQQHEESDKKKKSIALKATSTPVNDEEDDDSDSTELNEENLTLLVKKFGKFLKKK